MKFRVTTPAIWPVALLASVVLSIVKLTGHLDWPWVWVLAPVWACVALGLALFVVLLSLLPLLDRALRVRR